jgi:hypothetical protein
MHFTMSFPSQILRHLLHAVTITHIAVEAFIFVILIRTQALMQILTQIQPLFLMREFFRAVCSLLCKLKRLSWCELFSAPSAGLELPPSYDEVIRLPNQYPKLNSTTVTPVSENPPPTIAEIEANGHSITTISSLSPAVFTNQQRNSPNRASVS